MERDYDFSSRIYFDALEDAEAIGRSAGERAVKRLGARQAKTGRVNVVYRSARCARHCRPYRQRNQWRIGCAQDQLSQGSHGDERYSANTINVTDDPLRVRGPSSRPFDGEGMEGVPLNMIENGVLKHWFLSTSTAKELGLDDKWPGCAFWFDGSPVFDQFRYRTRRTGHPKKSSVLSGRASTLQSCSAMAWIWLPVNTVAVHRDFWIENGELAYPVSEVTIASNLKEMFLNLVAANDIDRNFGVASPTLLIEGMTLAGK